jgi:hypothetical protein
MAPKCGMLGGMASQELMGRVAELRRNGRTPKEIARALGLKPAEVAPLIRAVGAATPAREAELVGCWITDGWSEGLAVNGHPEWPGVESAAGGASGLASVLVAREHGSGVSACGYLVDVWCLGVKNSTGPKTMDRRKLPDFVSLFFRASSRPPVPAPLDLARNVVFGAVDYARGLGFEPHPDFAKCAGHLGQWNQSSDVTFGRNGKPMYMQGPHDDVFAVLSTLRRSVGGGSFDYVGRVG